MVWSQIGMMVVGQAFASESGVLMQSQAEYHHALVSDEKQKVGVGGSQLRASGNRISKIEDSAKIMADSYGALLKKIVDTHSLVDPNTGSPFTPPPAMMTALNDTFNGLEQQLEAERDTNQGLVDTAYDHVNDCNTKRDEDFTKAGGVDELKAAAETHRGTHSECRDQEILDENDEAAKRTSFDGTVSDCQKEYGYFTDYGKSANQDAANSLTNVLATANALEGAVNTLTARQTLCDQGQTAFETHFCHYANKLESVCQIYDNCHAGAVQDWGAVNGSVHELEKSQKVVLKMLRKVMCYINALAKATPDNMPTQDTITHCSQLGTTSDNTIDTSSLDITYTTPPAAVTCDTTSVTHKMDGSGRFAVKEYAHSRFGTRVETSRASC